ncbi:MAG: amidohydrolase [Clostridia bacterium]|nr:amidohydrolase [Clostridia bacterium]
MEYKWIINDAEKLEDEIVRIRQELHKIAEVGFSLENTCRFVRNELEAVGCKVELCGRQGLVCTIEGQGKGDFSDKCVLLRADMDALPIKEETELEFKSENGNMHACGHDMHTAMLIGCAKILFSNRDKFSHKIKLIFQSAEETLEGAKDMIDNGVLESPTVNCGAMLHIISGTNLDTGALVFANSGVSAPSAEFFKVSILGKSAHGAMPQSAVNPIVPVSHIALAFDSLIAQEAKSSGNSLLTIGELHSGKAPNVISDRATITGTLRSFEEESKGYLKLRMKEIVELYSQAHRTKGTLEFTSSCPALTNDQSLISVGIKNIKDAYSIINHSKPLSVLRADELESKSFASEDFAYFSKKIPTVMVGISGGKMENGFTYPLHHPKTSFDEKALFYGTIVYCVLGISLAKGE